MSNAANSGLKNKERELFFSMRAALGLLTAQMKMIDPFDSPHSIEPLDHAVASSLSAFEQQIADLSQQLCGTIEGYAGLRRSLYEKREEMPIDLSDHHLDPIAHAPSPISRCSYEILGDIFELVIQDGSHLIQPLLMVNKRFNGLAMSESRLWRKVFIEINYQFEEVNSLSVAYVNACLERSKGLLLDIAVNGTHIPWPQDFVWERVKDVIQQSSADEEDKEGVLDLIEIPERGTINLYDRRLRRALAIPLALVGPDGIHAQRWRSVIIKCPGEDAHRATTLLLDLLSGEMPNLETLVIHCDLDLIAFTDDLSKFSWPKVTNFTSYAQVNLSKAPINLRSLTILRFSHYNSRWAQSNLTTLNECRSLQELFIMSTTLSYDFVQSNPAHIHLPSLTSLTLVGEVHLLDSTQFDLPNLKRWELTCDLHKYFPAIPARHMKYSFSKAGDFQNETSGLLRLFSSFKKTKTIKIVNTVYPKETLTWIRDQEVANLLPDCLEKVVVFGAGVLDLRSDI